MKKQNYFTIPQAAKELGISRVTMFRRVKSKKVRCIRVGKLYLIPKSEILKPVNSLERKRLDQVIAKVMKDYKETLDKLADE